jgi:hypothetical protein
MSLRGMRPWAGAMLGSARTCSSPRKQQQPAATPNLRGVERVNRELRRGRDNEKDEPSWRVT